MKAFSHLAFRFRNRHLYLSSCNLWNSDFNKYNYKKLNNLQEINNSDNTFIKKVK